MRGEAVANSHALVAYPRASARGYELQQQQQQVYASAPGGAYYAEDSEPGYFDTMWHKRREVCKLCILALVILLAISGHSTVWHYLQDYIDIKQLEGAAELALRAAYPVAVLIVLWNVKSFMSSASPPRSSWR